MGFLVLCPGILDTDYSQYLSFITMTLQSSDTSIVVALRRQKQESDHFEGKPLERTGHTCRAEREHREPSRRGLIPPPFAWDYSTNTNNLSSGEARGKVGQAVK